MAKIEKNNADSESGHVEGVNQFSIYTAAEFVGNFLRAKPPKGTVTSVAPVLSWPPPTKDWSATRFVTPVKDQGLCGACWAFSAIAAIESMRIMVYNTTSDLSEQQLVDCSGSYGNGGCGGGWMVPVFRYVRDKGITTTKAYKYTSASTGITGRCVIDRGAFKISGHTNITRSCDRVAAALQLRPLSVAVDATNWSQYQSGIFSNCGTSLNHAVLLVGVSADVWKIKNSWGTNWGISGFMLLKATRGNNACGICSVVSYPNK